MKKADSKAVGFADSKLVEDSGQHKIVEVSVVLPSKDEEETIGICVGKMKKVFNDNGLTAEVIVADRSQSPLNLECVWQSRSLERLIGKQRYMTS